MIRPNCVLDAPPEWVEARGVRWAVNADYRVWLRVLDRLRALSRGEDALEEVFRLALGGVPPVEAQAEVLRALLAFLQGYPSAPTRGGAEGGEALSLEYDLSEIAVAIRDQHGVDVSYRRTEPLHWWDFLLLTRTLAGEHRALRLAEIRGYAGNDPQLKRLRERYRLPDEREPKREAILGEIAEAFYNA